MHTAHRSHIGPFWTQLSVAPLQRIKKKQRYLMNCLNRAFSTSNYVICQLLWKLAVYRNCLSLVKSRHPICNLSNVLAQRLLNLFERLPSCSRLIYQYNWEILKTDLNDRFMRLLYGKAWRKKESRNRQVDNDSLCSEQPVFKKIMYTCRAYVTAKCLIPQMFAQFGQTGIIKRWMWRNAEKSNVA